MEQSFLVKLLVFNKILFQTGSCKKYMICARSGSVIHLFKNSVLSIRFLMCNIYQMYENGNVKKTKHLFY